MIQTVGDVIRELQRFNPNARVEPCVDIQGVSPAIECRITDVVNAELATKNYDLEEENDELSKTIEDIKSAMGEFEAAFLKWPEQKPRLDKAFKELQEALS